MKSIIRLIRLPNLLIIALTLYFTKYFLIRPMIELGGGQIKLSSLDFFLLNLSVIFIAAAGYIINDYFDTKIDFINRPSKVVIGKRIERRHAILSHIILSGIGTLLGFYLGYKVGLPKLGLIHTMTVGLLWYYSTDFKKMFLIGNIIVAALSGVIPLLAALFEPNKIFISFFFIKGFVVFAFLISLIREIVKDIEDKEGDGAHGCKTLPIVIGTTGAQIVAVLLCLVMACAVGYIQLMQYQSKDMISFWYFTIAIEIPLFLLMFLILKAKTPKHFHNASTLSKVIMLSGVIAMFIFHYSLFH